MAKVRQRYPHWELPNEDRFGLREVGDLTPTYGRQCVVNDTWKETSWYQRCAMYRLHYPTLDIVRELVWTL